MRSYEMKRCYNNWKRGKRKILGNDKNFTN